MIFLVYVLLVVIGILAIFAATLLVAELNVVNRLMDTNKQLILLVAGQNEKPETLRALVASAKSPKKVIPGIADKKKKKDELYVVSQTPFQQQLKAATKLGRVSKDKFWNSLGGVTCQKFFRRVVAELHYVSIVEYEDGTCEVVVNKAERNLMDAVRSQLERMKKSSVRWNRFKFDVTYYKKSVQELYDLVCKGSTH